MRAEQYVAGTFEVVVEFVVLPIFQSIAKLLTMPSTTEES
jgi:hypothetical protein